MAAHTAAASTATNQRSRSSIARCSTIQPTSVAWESVASNPVADTEILLTSRFILWDEFEKMIDNDFKIHIIFENETSNHTAYYEVLINDLNYSGMVEHYTVIDVSLNNTEIASIIINIDNITIYQVYDLIIIEGFTGGHVKRGLDEWLISLNPLEWSNFQWNIFFSVVSAFIVSIFVSLKLVKYYRKRKKVTVVK